MVAKIKAPAMPLRVLAIDDDTLMRNTLDKMLRVLGHEVDTASSGDAGIQMLREKEYDLVLVDYMMPRMDGMETLRKIREGFDPPPEVTLMTAYGSIKSAVEAMRLGAYDYITKPFEPNEIQRILGTLAERKSLRSENRQLRSALREKYQFQNIVGVSPAMRSLYELLLRASRSDATVLIQGESGTGKELVARAIHFNSRRAEGPFVPVDCSAINPNLIEAELFGHVKGAFTGAHQERIGLFRSAHGGTLFLDELSEILFEIQAKLLRAIQERTVKPVGSTSQLEVDVRIIAASNKDLNKAIEAGEFREDLFFRLNVIPIHVPPLRDRLDDLPLLVEHFVKKYLPAGRMPPSLAPAALDAIRAYAWPGNVRELENAVERSVILGTDDVIDLDDLPENVRRAAAAPAKAPLGPPVPLEEMEQRLVRQAIEYTQGDKGKAARLLGVDRSTLYRKLKRYGDASEAGEPPS